jgi:hypothetical protein
MEQPQSKSLKEKAESVLQKTIGDHPMAAAITIAVLVVLLIILIIVAVEYKKEADSSKSKFGVSRYNNLNMGGNNPMWWNGAGHAGKGGTIDRDPTQYHMMHYHKGAMVGAAPSGAMAEAEGLNAMGALPKGVISDDRLQSMLHGSDAL